MKRKKMEMIGRGAAAFAAGMGLWTFWGVLLGAFLVMGFSTGAGAEETHWRLYTESPDFYWYFNAEGIKLPSGGYLSRIRDFVLPRTVKVWTKRAARGERGTEREIAEQKRLGLSSVGYEEYGYTLYEREVRCADSMYRILSETDFTRGGGKLGAYTPGPTIAGWKAVLPDTEEDALYRLLCTAPKKRAPEPKDTRPESPPVQRMPPGESGS
ncbi:MAG: hypothetical protein K8I29_01525 [Alphaproteobacteria bacterium]|uniref:Uncharacterized protein n=1 Tax=Candidatus Nitrobium versatile TaxID=2884831 RepID=A0A953J986_9BACT|nr:hypothetical protein [Candidatus Nitrobium versatile]